MNYRDEINIIKFNSLLIVNNTSRVIEDDVMLNI